MYPSLSPVPDTGLLKPCNFLSDRRVFRSNEANLVTPGQPPEWGLVTRKNKPWLGAWNFRSHSPFSGEGKGLKRELMINHACVRETSTKVLKVWGSESFQVAEHVDVLRKGCPWESATHFPRTMGIFAIRMMICSLYPNAFYLKVGKQ